MIIALSGPPKAGKSRLRGEIYRLLREREAAARQRGEKFPRWFIEVASPDAEGAWVNDAHTLGIGESAEALARRIKSKIKEVGEFFSPTFVEMKARQLQGLAAFAEVLIIDLGGLPSQENRDLLGGLPRERIHTIVLTREDGSDGGWAAFWQGFGAPVIYRGPYREDLAQALLEALELEVA